MAIRICKFGGSSVADAAGFARVRDIVRALPERRYIVLSAPGSRAAGEEKITDLLYRAQRAQTPEDRFIFARIRERYVSIYRDLNLHGALDAALNAVEARLHISADETASRGEYLCARLFAEYIGFPFVDASELIFFEAGGALDIDRTRSAVRSRLADIPRAVIPGFYGSLPDGRIHSFPRGGSDISGALIAAALDADLYENWTDVDGLYSADPRLIPEAVRQKTVSYREMRALSEAGARVLHPDCLEPVRLRGIDTMLKNTFQPDAPGTRITERFDSDVCCVTGRRGLFLPDAVKRASSDAFEGLQSDPAPGAQAVCVLSVFAPERRDRLRIAASLRTLFTLELPGQIRLMLPDAQFEAAVRRVHEGFGLTPGEANQ